MSDMVSRLRVLANNSRKVYGLHAADCAAAMDGAASHIELLEAAYKSSGSALAVIEGGFKNAVAEIKRLRLTDAEREAVEAILEDPDLVLGNARDALRGLLERLSGSTPISGAGQSGQTGKATPEPAIPPAWMARPYWVDPPSGHRYGFPRLYNPASDGDMTAWMIRNGYPEQLARQQLPCTFTAVTEDGDK